MQRKTIDNRQLHRSGEKLLFLSSANGLALRHLRRGRSELVSPPSTSWMLSSFEPASVGPDLALSFISGSLATAWRRACCQRVRIFRRSGSFSMKRRLRSDIEIRRRSRPADRSAGLPSRSISSSNRAKAAHIWRLPPAWCARSGCHDRGWGGHIWFRRPVRKGESSLAWSGLPCG